MPSGSDILVIWIELLVLAGQINDCGSVYFNHEVPYTTDLLSAQFDYPPTTIQLALTTFTKFGMIEIIDDIIKISNWQRYQNEEALERIRLAHNARQRAYYQRQKALKIEGECVSTGVSAGVSNDVISDENCSIYISNISSLSKDNEDKDKGCGEKGKEPKRGEEDSPMFDLFWDAYGNKKGKKNARKAFQRINPDEELFQRIMDGIEKYHNSRKWREGYRKEPATWLNGECWNDEYDDEPVRDNRQSFRSREASNSPYKPDGTYDYEGGESDNWGSV